jgi:hypothetical protein
MDQLFALGNVSNWNEILEIAPYEISGDHHAQMQTVAEGNSVLAASDGCLAVSQRRSSISSRVDNGKIAEHRDAMADIARSRSEWRECKWSSVQFASRGSVFLLVTAGLREFRWLCSRHGSDRRSSAFAPT